MRLLLIQLVSQNQKLIQIIIQHISFCTVQIKTQLFTNQVQIIFFYTDLMSYSSFHPCLGSCRWVAYAYRDSPLRTPQGTIVPDLPVAFLLALYHIWKIRRSLLHYCFHKPKQIISFSSFYTRLFLLGLGLNPFKFIMGLFIMGQFIWATN